MTAILPQGLISPPTIEQHTFGESSTDLDNQEILRRFWRVYAIQSDASQDSASVRARNLFWRVWSCPRLAQSINSATLMRLLRRTGQEFELDLIGDTVPLTPLLSQQVSHDSKQLAPENPPTSSESDATQAPRSSLQDFRFPVAAASREQQRRRQSSTGASTSAIDDTSGSTSNTASESSSKPSLTRSGSNGRQRLSVLATVGKSRTRPHLPRRKSSTPKSPSVTNPPKLPKQSLEKGGSNHTPQQAGGGTSTRPAQGNLSLGLLQAPSTTSDSTFALPSASSWQSVDSTTESRKLATTAPQPTLGDLVDPGFRVKFVENQKKLSSVTNLAGLERVRKSISTVRFADESPEDNGKGKEKSILPAIEYHRSGPSHMKSNLKGPEQGQQARTSRGDDDESDGDSDDDEDDNLQMQLPRTKSQLSLLIQHKRDQTGSQDLGPTSPPEEAVKPLLKEKSKEEELLSMGRRDGVTKAGGVQTARQLRVFGRDEPEDLSSSSPEPLF